MSLASQTPWKPRITVMFTCLWHHDPAPTGKLLVYDQFLLQEERVNPGGSTSYLWGEKVKKGGNFCWTYMNSSICLLRPPPGGLTTRKRALKRSVKIRILDVSPCLNQSQLLKEHLYMNSMQTCNSITFYFMKKLIFWNWQEVDFAKTWLGRLTAARLTALIMFWQNPLPANFRKWVFPWNKTWRNYKFAWNSCVG